jgi:hypothetical protein
MCCKWPAGGDGNTRGEHSRGRERLGGSSELPQGYDLYLGQGQYYLR